MMVQPQIATTQVSVTDADQIGLSVYANASFTQRMFQNLGADTVYIGNDAVTAATGYPIASGETFTDAFSGSSWYAICDTGDSATVSVLTETGTTRTKRGIAATTQKAVDDSPRVALSIFAGNSFVQRVFKNTGADTVWLGGSSVTASTGIKLAAGASFTDYSPSSWYGICGSGDNTTVAVLTITSTGQVVSASPELSVPTSSPSAASSAEVDAGVVTDKYIPPSALAGSGYGPAGVKRYVFTATQSGTDAPVVTVLLNTLGGVPVWAYDGPGTYVGTLVGAFPVGKVGPTCGLLNATIANAMAYTLSRSSDDTIHLISLDHGAETNEVLGGPQTFEVVVYP